MSLRALLAPRSIAVVGASHDPAKLGHVLLKNVVEVVRAAGGKAENLVSLTVFVTDKREYLASLKPLGAESRRVMGRHYPAMALVQVAGLVEDGAKVEIQGLAVL